MKLREKVSIFDFAMPDLPIASSALLAFRAENARSFGGGFELSMLATALADRSVVRDLPWRDKEGTVGVLPVAGIFGANASGKSNVLRVMQDMRWYVLHSFRQVSPTGTLPRWSFHLDTSASDAPSTYEVDLILDGVRHEYGFVVADERIVEEWALHYPRGRAAVIFRREGDQVALGAADRAKGSAIRELLRPNALFLSTAAAANHRPSQKIFRWFERRLVLAEVESRLQRQALTAEMLDDPKQHARVLALLRVADLGLTGAEKHEIDPDLRARMEKAARVFFGEEEGADLGDFELDAFGVRLKHRGTEGDVVMPAELESMGTQVWFGLVGPVLSALDGGWVLLADELDASLHPALVHEIVRLFQDPRTNPRNAQLIFNSHDVTLLGDSSGRLLGRDQVWFTEKLNTGITRIYPLSDLDPRKDEALGRRYLAGRYGAVPIVTPAELDEAVALVPTANAS